MPIANSKHLKPSVERPHTAEHYYVHDPFIDDSEHALDECTYFAPLPIRTRPALLKYLHTHHHLPKIEPTEPSNLLSIIAGVYANRDQRRAMEAIQERSTKLWTYTYSYIYRCSEISSK